MPYNSTMLYNTVRRAIAQTLETDDFVLLTPKDPAMGDYAINIHSLSSLKSDFTQDSLVQKLLDPILFSTVQKKGSFINFFLHEDILVDELDKIFEQKRKYGSYDKLKSLCIIVEFAHPNTHKLFHIGHARNITIGESLVKILSNAGAKVIRANYQGDVGLHISKCLWKVKGQMSKVKSLKTLDAKIAFLGKCYAEGSRAYQKDKKAKREIQEINKQIYATDSRILPLLEKTRMWSLEYFGLIYKRFGTTFDRLFFESEVANLGLQITQKALEKGILEKDDGAVILRGDKYNVDTRVFINSAGLPTYEAKELGLAQLEFSEFGAIDKCIHVVGPEQKSFFKTTFKVQELLDPKKYKNKQVHHVYGYVNLKDGKMSSREGTVVEGNWLLDMARQRLKETFDNLDEKIAETLAVSAVKYGFLKIDSRNSISFDIDESISISGNSGPYLLYTYARCRSVLRKAEKAKKTPNLKLDLSNEDLLLLRLLPRFPDVIASATEQLAPHHICTYLFYLAQRFNHFYEKRPILKADENARPFRLALTQASAQIMKNGLYLLGINILEKI